MRVVSRGGGRESTLEEGRGGEDRGDGRGKEKELTYNEIPKYFEVFHKNQQI